MPGVLLAVRRVGELPDRFTVGLEHAALRPGRPVAISDWNPRDAWTRPPRPSSSARARPRPQELVDAAIAPDRGAQPAAQRGHPRALRAGARRGRRAGPSRRAVQGRPVPVQGPRRRLRRPAASPGDEAAEGRGLPRSGRHLPRRALPRRRASSSIGKTNTPELGILPTTEPEAYGAEPQPVGHRRARPAARAAARRRGRLRAWSRSRTPTTAAARSGSRPAVSGLVGLKPTRQRISEGPLVGDV